MVSNGNASRFEELMLSHMDAAYNLARWLTRNDHDAQDVVQEAYLRAFRFSGSFRHGQNGRAWLLAIVRNTFYTWLQQKRPSQDADPFDESIHSSEDSQQPDGNPETLALQQADRQLINAAIEKLPEDFREVLVLRELEDLSYKEIAEIAGLPLGTVMSRLARARGLLRKNLQQMIAG